jgi:hypothetical protein
MLTEDPPVIPNSHIHAYDSGDPLTHQTTCLGVRGERFTLFPRESCPASETKSTWLDEVYVSLRLINRNTSNAHVVLLIPNPPPETLATRIPHPWHYFIEHNHALEASSNLLNTVSAVGRSPRLSFQQLSRVLQRESVNPTFGRSGSSPSSNLFAAAHLRSFGKISCPQTIYLAFMSQMLRQNCEECAHLVDKNSKCVYIRLLCRSPVLGPRLFRQQHLRTHIQMRTLRFATTRTCEFRNDARQSEICQACTPLSVDQHVRLQSEVMSDRHRKISQGVVPP